MAGPSHEPANRHEQLRLAVEQALTEFLLTKAERDRLDNLMVDAMNTPDWDVAVRNAMRLHRLAMQQLENALRALAAFNRNRYSSKRGWRSSESTHF
jgi:hypothetical protein